MKNKSFNFFSIATLCLVALLNTSCSKKQVTPSGPKVSTLASCGSFNDGRDPQAIISFIGITSIALDASGNAYVAQNNLIKKITPSGEVSTFAGNGKAANVDGIGTVASFYSPVGVAVDATGNVYVADLSNNSIRKITPDGVVSTLAGSGKPGYADGLGKAASFNSPWGITVDAVGNVYVADNGNSLVRKITPAGMVSTIINHTSGKAATFDSIQGIAVDAAGNIYASTSYLISKITPSGIVSTFAGSDENSGLANGIGTAAFFKGIRGITIDAVGNLYAADGGNNLIRKITPQGVVSILAGSGAQGKTDGLATAASFNNPAGVAIDALGNVYVADGLNNLVRKITPQ